MAKDKGKNEVGGREGGAENVRRAGGWGGGGQNSAERTGAQREKGSGTLRWRQREAQRENARDEGKQGVSKMSQMCGEAEGTKGRPCFFGPFALGWPLEGIPGPAQQTYGHRVDEAVAGPAWPASRVLGALGRKRSSVLHLSENLLSRRGGGRT